MYSNENIQQIETQFRLAMLTCGINYSGEIISDGNLHRFHIESHKRGSRNGAYVLHADKRPTGWFMDYKSGVSQTWRLNGGSRISFALIHQIKGAQKQREVEINQKHEAAAKRAISIWGTSTPIFQQGDHPYLTKKRIQPHGTRLYRHALVIPIYNESDKLVNLQFISPDGERKLFLSGGRKRSCFHIIGNLSEKLLICEGFATGASLHQDSGQRVVIAFDAGNLVPVAKNIRELSPYSEIIICGDNDLSGVGQEKAKEAALAIDGKVLIPPIPGKDWNDLIAGGCQHG